MVALWSVSRALQIPIDKRITELQETPYTLSYVIRKRQQIDNFAELSKEKRPPEKMIWDGNSDEIEQWLDRVLDYSGKKNNMAEFVITDVEG